MLIKSDQSLLLVVDIQEKLAPAIHQGNNAIDNNLRLLAVARQLAIPRFISEQYVRGLGPSVTSIKDVAVDAEFFEKIHFSCAREPGVVDKLKATGRQQIILTGMEAHVCVLQTALGLQEAGFDVFLVADATSSRTPENRQAAIERLRHAGVSIATTEMVLFEWLEKAGTEAFRAALPLIKQTALALPEVIGLHFFTLSRELGDIPLKRHAMTISLNPCRLLFLDLRQNRHGEMPPLAGLEQVNPTPGSDCKLAMSALAVFVAIDGEAAYTDWRERFHPMCPSGFPHVILLDPYSPTLARKALTDDATDCCAINDYERMELIVARLERPQESTDQPWQPSVDMALFFRLQLTLDTLPCPIFIKNRSGRYIACNKALEDQLGLTRSQIIGASVYDIAPPELAKIYDEADRELMAKGGSQSYETRLRFADGSLHDVVFYKTVFLDTAGEVDGISGTTLDITERKILEKKLEHAAATDFLTGVYNLRSFYELAGQEFRRFTRSGQELSLIVIDLDFFKEINDTLGHSAGDQALHLFVHAVQANLRDQDIFARAGGDEFRIILPDTLPSGAALVAERIRASVNQIEIKNEKGSMRLSISAGICSCLPGDESLDEVTKRADAALYIAKASGRNRVHPVFLPQ